MKPIESPSTDLENLTDKENKDQITQSESKNSHNLVVPGQCNIPLRLEGLHSNGLDGDLVLHKEETNCTSSRLGKSQGLPNHDSIEEECPVAEYTCLVNTDPLTKSSTIVTQLSSIEEQEDFSINPNIINDDGKHFY